MKPSKSLNLILLLCCLLFAFGCGQKDKEQVYVSDPLTSAHTELVRMANEEYDIFPVIKSIDNTTWIYVPLEEDILDIRASGFGLKLTEEKEEPIGINFLNGQFKEPSFDIAYDIGPGKKYNVAYGYGTSYPPKIQDIQRSLLTIISRVYSDVKEVPGENKYVFALPGDSGPTSETHDKLVQAHTQSEYVPEFFIIIVGDVRKGLEMRLNIAFKDLRRVMQDPTFTEEYTRRAVYEQPVGNKNMIGDKEGNYLVLEPMTWPLFIAKQIAYRVQYKFTQSSKKPTNDIETEILASANAAINAYNFHDFSSVVLRNLGAETEEVFEKTALADYAPDETEPKGKIHHIKFF